jgi:hypothetical protein
MRTGAGLREALRLQSSRSTPASGGADKIRSRSYANQYEQAAE